MSLSLQRLLPLFDAERAAQHPMVLATVLRTAGPTYSKPGALMLISESGAYAGLLSGGCLEGDLAEHGRGVLKSGQTRTVRYDMRGPDDLLFGLGSGCEGAMDILLQRIGAESDWQPLAQLAAAWRARVASSMLLVAESADARYPVGSGLFAPDGPCFGTRDEAPLGALLSGFKLPARNEMITGLRPGVEILTVHQPPPAELLLLGAGLDAQPVAQLAAFLGWRVTVLDHRSQYAKAARFPDAAIVLDTGAAGLAALLSSPSAPVFAASIVMSHHLPTDLAYLHVLTGTAIPYVGLLGPEVRRERLLRELGAEAARLKTRLRAPVGLDLGASTPEAIALSIVAEIQGTLAGVTSMSPLSRRHA